MFHPDFMQFRAAEHIETLRRDARVVRGTTRRPVVDTRDVELRLCRPADDSQLDRLAELEGRPLPQGRFVLAAVRGRIVAALPLAGGEPLRDPFARTEHLVKLLQVRAGQLRGPAPPALVDPPLRQPDPRVDPRVDRVDREVEDDDAEGGEHDHTLHRGEVEVVDRPERELAEPGSPKTVSVKKAPASARPTSMPRMVTIGRSALRSTCLRMTCGSDAPFERAVRTKSSPSVSIV